MILLETDKEKTIKTRVIRGVKHFIDPPTMYKLGFTVQKDARIRFTEDFLKRENYVNIAPEIGFEVIIKWSGFFSRERIRYYEGLWESKFPKNIWTTDRYTGYSEYRYLPEAQANRWVKFLKDKYPKDDNGHRDSYYKLYFAKFEKKVPYKTQYDDK